MSIATMLEKSKIWLSTAPKDVLFLLVSLLAVSASFGLGMITERAIGERGDLEFTTIPASGGLSAAAIAGIATGTPSSVEKAAIAAPTAGKYVASKSGTRYYLPTCSGANRIKPENRVWFATKEAAEVEGLTPATNCPGL